MNWIVVEEEQKQGKQRVYMSKRTLLLVKTVWITIEMRLF